MAEQPSKRQRDNQDHPHTKKQRPYDDMILYLLEDDEDVPSNQDLSSFITSLQREIDEPAGLSTSSSATSLVNKEDANEEDQEDRERERVMQRLLEASDDELGLPSRDEGSGEFGWGEGVFFDGLWEIEHLLHPDEEEELLL